MEVNMNNESGTSRKPVLIQTDADLIDLIPVFVGNRKKDLDRLADLVKNQDYVEIQRLGHTLKGVCASYGFISLGQLGKTLEDQAKAQDQEGIRATMEEMDFIIHNHVIEEK